MILRNRFAIVFCFVLIFILGSSVVRGLLAYVSLENLDFQFLHLLRIFATGTYFDFAVAIDFILLYSFYLLMLPSRWIGSVADKLLTYFFLTIMLLIMLFGMIAEFPFWAEFNARFNFIAVDYLIYTYEVFENIQQSYPLPMILAALVIGVGVILYYFKIKGVFNAVFSDKMRLKIRALYVLPIWIIAFTFYKTASNQQAEFSPNNFENELSKNGIFSFFSAYNSNELDYNTFYSKLQDSVVNSILRNELIQDNQEYINQNDKSILRFVKNYNEKNYNIILITIESFSADFLKRFGNKDNLCPNFEDLATQSVFFTNMYATGTRTVRGMEALTLCVPPTPGNSIVRRPDNDHIFSIATILREKNYKLDFIYGGDGYFDNMNNFFGGQGFNIVDRDRGNPLSDKIVTQRINIPDNEVSFENAWGICDEDIYFQSLKSADKHTERQEHFFQFIMTCSNHRPYTFPSGKIDLPQGSREAAVKYTDYALGKFINSARTKSWFNNTVFVIVADHCASSAGKWELSVDKHHIPAMIFNVPGLESEELKKLCSQIDLMPTVFGILNWTYVTALYGKDVQRMKPKEERALIGNYRTLGLLTQNYFTIINDRKKVIQYHWDQSNSSLQPLEQTKDSLKDLTITYFQSASNRFHNGLMKENKNQYFK